MGLQEVDVGNPEPNKLKHTLHLLSSRRGVTWPGRPLAHLHGVPGLL